MSVSRLLTSAGALAITACLAPAAALAQNAAEPATAAAPQPANAAPTEGLAEIVVTAQKRAQNLQDVPVAVTALSADTLVSHNVSTVADLPRLAPSLTLTQGNVPTNNSINLRGIGTVAFSTAIEPSVAVIVDDVALLQQAQAFSGLSDVERIEVLRGPQGTLFGKNASAGAINIVSKAATDTLTGSITGTATTDEEYRLDASLSGPLAQGVGFRINGFVGDRKGYIRNLQDGSKLNNDKSFGLRGRLDLDPAAGVKVNLIASHSESESNGFARTFRAVPAGAAIFGTPVAPSVVGITPGTDNYSVRLDKPLFNKSMQTTVSGRASFDLGFANLVSVTSYQDWKFRFNEDFDYTISNVLGIPGGIVAGSTYHATQFAQELRLVSPGQRRLTYVLGLFYADGKTDRTFARGPSGPVVAGWTSRSGTRSYAAFGQATYDIAQGTHFDLGLRLNHEKISADFLNTVTPATIPANNATCLSTCSGKSDDTALTWKGALRQDLTRSVMAYASYARGYKGQGFDISTGFTPRRAANPVRPEKSDAYELGLKSRFLDNRVQLNVAAFWSNFRDFQAQSGVLLPDNTIQLTLNNVGRVRTRGVEVELNTRPMPQLTIDGAFSYTDTRILEYSGAQCYTGQTVGCYDLDGSGPSTTTGQNLAGKGLPNAPKVKFNIGGNYKILLPSLPFDAFVQADYSYQSKVNFDLLGNPATVQAGYGIVNASLGIDQNDRGGLRVTLFVNNLFDKHYASNVSIASGGSAGLLAQSLDRNSRRYFGLRARYQF
ncbi:TonB-dependent receptor [Novosphingobium sp. SG720]|uniref:TonB-dependent receptor n=1 Tax=Novosphingobium TaxID=165696 RepID=UPI001444EBFE|nr:TonB-dependent receptor [Novosphingobium sp. SG720]NKJ44027.1 iron complex outermembrane receptor protein [Novosphingobium sp. SG720]